MSNFLEAAYSMLKYAIRDDDDRPLHIGEAMACWTYFTALAEADSYVQVGIHTTMDRELRATLGDALKLCKSQTKRLQEFMQKEGIELPEVQQEKVDSDPTSVPPGVRLTDAEIANGLSLKMAGALVACATSISQSIRNDVGTMWAAFLVEEIAFGASLKTIMKRRGWLKSPPAFHPPGSPRR